MIRAMEKLDFRAKEAYKSLRTNLEFSGADVKVVALTSCTEDEGKTSTSFQLAVSLAEAGKKTILVDADLRKSVMHGRYKATRKAISPPTNFFATPSKRAAIKTISFCCCTTE